MSPRTVSNTASPSPSTARPRTGRCPHCGTPVEGAEDVYCCTGCEIAAELIRGAGLERYYAMREEFAPRPGPLYIAVSGGVGLLTGLILLWGIWRAKAWTWYALIGTGAGITVWYWCDRLFFQSARTNWPFALGVNILFLILVIFCVVHPHTKNFLIQREKHDR